MVSESLRYVPDIAVPPGVTLAEVLEERGTSQVELARRLGCSKDHISRIIRGVATITPTTALALEVVLGIPAAFWHNLESNYQDARLRLDRRGEFETWAVFLEGFPYAELAKRGVIAPARDVAGKVENMLRFFGVANPDAIEAQYAAAFRCAQGRRPSGLARAAWVRMGELSAAGIATQPFDEPGLRRCLEELRALAATMPADFDVCLRQKCADLGIALVYMPHLPHTYAQGGTRWLSPTKAMVALSISERNADVFWFSLFHELGHVLHHRKSETFIRDERQEGSLSRQEAEADAHARDTLIPPRDFERLRRLGPRYSEAAILRFASSIGTHPGIVVGRLQWERLLPYNQLNRLRVKLRWHEDAA